MQSTDRPRARATLGALLIDLVCVVAFCAIGRRTHTEGLTVGGVAETSWPFLTGTALGWLLSRGWQRPVALAPTGLVVWVCTVVVAMLLRRATSQGTAVSFIVVASVTTAVLLIGWRAAAQLISRR
ncbi:MAG: DUF3054 domain-containing protein [Actinomycetia bacterium]|nr:DUF3054 domain-containing protein [Actinomycetes bacterium]